MKTPNKANLWEALKELARIVILAIISYLLAEGLVDMAVTYFWGEHLSPFIVLQIVGIMTAVLRTVDKFLHQWGKDTGNLTLYRGLTSF